MLKTDSNPYVSKKTSLLKFISAMPLADMLYHVSKTNTEKTEDVMLLHSLGTYCPFGFAIMAAGWWD